eukprot:3938669-Rhodomonas_salina.1
MRAYLLVHRELARQRHARQVRLLRPTRAQSPALRRETRNAACKLVAKLPSTTQPSRLGTKAT